MAITTGGIDVDLQRRLALECLPPSELRDDYLCYLDGLERKARLAAGLPERAGGETAALLAGNEAHPWTARRYAFAAVGAVVFVVGASLLTSMF